jgi:pimeloyl-ACP methyl ester carboxylesterase
LQSTSLDIARRDDGFSSQSKVIGKKHNISPQRVDSFARAAEPLGLQVLYEPSSTPSVNIIFVHGLGGSTLGSWSWNRDPSYCWPREWLPREPNFRDARILSFGYSAHFMDRTESSLNITDFAKDLLFQMGQSLAISNDDAPIIFIAHSLGGLIVKKAYLLGRNNSCYATTMLRVQAMVFYATAHHGSNLAEVLNRTLVASSRSPKAYISDLVRNSSSIEETNEQFRYAAHELQIFSFYETLKTNVGINRMVSRYLRILGELER